MRDEDLKIRQVLTTARTIALVGASANATRDSHEVMAFLQARGYRVIPVNPGLEGQTLLGERVYADVLEIPESIDLVDIFRNSEAAGHVVDQAIAKGAKAVWLQLGVINAPAIRRAEAAGLTAIMDRCPKIEIRRLGINLPLAR
jgi:predicted CoA-binding protein